METGLQAFLLLALHRGEWHHNLAVSPFQRKLDLVPGRILGAGENRKVSASAENPTVFRVVRSLYLLGYPGSPIFFFFHRIIAFILYPLFLILPSSLLLPLLSLAFLAPPPPNGQ
jgi:hypothetical protein